MEEYYYKPSFDKDDIEVFEVYSPNGDLICTVATEEEAERIVKLLNELLKAQAENLKNLKP